MDTRDVKVLQAVAREAWDLVQQVRPELREEPAPWFLEAVERLERSLHVADVRGLMGDNDGRAGASADPSG